MGTLAPEKILRELSDLWVSQGKEARDEGGAGVLRACSMTLVVVTEASGDPAALGEILAALMPEHPARTIVVRLSGAGPASLEDRVYAQCWMPFGQRTQICCEQVEITASDAALLDLPPVVLPLAVADLPLILWCRSSRLFGRPEFAALASMAQKVVLDSAALGKAGLQSLGEMARPGTVFGDLAWTRLTRWRAMLSQVFENREMLSNIEKITSITVESPGDSPTSSSLYLGAWLADCLGAVGVRPRLSFSRGEWTGGGDPPLLMRVVLEGEGLYVEVLRWKDRMVTTVNGLAQCTNLPIVTEYALVREELALVRRDPIFERTLASALRLAYPNQ